MNIVFDLDGTLIDSAPDIQAAANAVLDPLEVAPLTLEETRSFIGEGSAVFIRKTIDARELPDAPQDVEALHRRFLDHYRQAVDRAVFYPGVESALTTLAEQGHRLGLCTNKPETAARSVVAHMQLERWFDAVVAGGMCKRHKPAPDMLLHTIELLGGGPTLYVGDSDIDAQTACNAETPFALFTEGYRKAPIDELPHDWSFADFGELHEIVREASRGT
jgi:phosphoglycolate phosphatase